QFYKIRAAPSPAMCGSPSQDHSIPFDGSSVNRPPEHLGYAARRCKSKPIAGSGPQGDRGPVPLPVMGPDRRGRSREISILYEDGEALVIGKPGGLPMDRPRAGGASLDDRLDELRLGFQRRPAPAHRLDTDTSGCLLLARNPKALKRFAAAFEARQVDKRYLGILAGLPRER